MRITHSPLALFFAVSGRGGKFTVYHRGSSDLRGWRTHTDTKAHTSSTRGISAGLPTRCHIIFHFHNWNAPNIDSAHLSFLFFVLIPATFDLRDLTKIPPWAGLAWTGWGWSLDWTIIMSKAFFVGQKCSKLCISLEICNNIPAIIQSPSNHVYFIPLHPVPLSPPKPPLYSPK